MQAAQTMHGSLHGGDRAFRGVSTDSRTIEAGELFIALRGPNFDGGRFVGDAAARGAAGAVVPQPTASNIPHIVVGDTRAALGQLAAAWRRSMPARVIGITGSNGKTTVKELVANCLSQSARTLATEGNLNNDIGMPLMLLRLAPEHRYAVMEMGANHPGEIAYLASLANAEVVVITNAAPAHLEGFVTIEGVARAKGEILETESRPTFAVLNADDRFLPYWNSKAADIEVVTFGLSTSADVQATDIETSEDGSTFTLHLRTEEVRIELPLAGRHNVRNACAAGAIAMVLGLTPSLIRRGLGSVRPVTGRLQPIEAPGGYLVYDDTYNANPNSVIAAAEFLAGQDDNVWLVLGDMAELGEESRALHATVGDAARRSGVRHLLATGDLSRHTVEAFGEGGQWFESVEELTRVLMQRLRPGSKVLVKGSRAAQMERVVDVLCAGATAAEVH